MRSVHITRRATLVLVTLLMAAGTLAGCAASNVATEHTGRFDGSRPIIAMGTCCIGYDPTEEVEAVFATDPKQPNLWLRACDKQGNPWPAGHRHDVYYTGDTVRPFHAKRPAAYRYQPPKAGEQGRFAINLAKTWPGLNQVNFHEFKAHDDGELTQEGTAEVKKWLRSHYSDKAEITKLGEGGFSIAYRVCRGHKDCLVVKIRKMPPTFAEWKRIKHAKLAASELKRDLAVSEVADAVTSWTSYLGKDGKPVPMLVDGKPLPAAPSKARGKPGRLARAGLFTNAKFLAAGAVEQKLIAFHASQASMDMMADARRSNSKWRTDGMSEAAFAGVQPGKVIQFFDTYHKLSKFGPDVIKAFAFFNACKRLDKVPTVKKYCVALRRDFAIPDDFDKRVAALEWMYRESAADVIRWSRNNFGRALGNPAGDGVFREIGLDFNHGRNAGWDPETRQFVLFDF